VHEVDRHHVRVVFGLLRKGIREPRHCPLQHGDGNDRNFGREFLFRSDLIARIHDGLAPSSPSTNARASAASEYHLAESTIGGSVKNFTTVSFFQNS
jgi:hypothetical protein